METIETLASLFGIFPDEVSKPQCVRHPDAHSPFVKLRNILIAGAALALPLVAVASPAGASTPHPKFITAIHRGPRRPSTSRTSISSTLAKRPVTHWKHPTTPGVIDGDFGPVAEVLGTIQDDNLQYNDGLSDTQISEVLGVSILYLCPSYEPGVKQFDQIEGSGVSDPGGGHEWVWQPGSSAPPPAPKYIGNAATAYKDGYADAGGGFFEYGSLSLIVRSLTLRSSTNGVGVPILSPTDAIIGHVANSPTVQSNYVAGCIAGVEASNNNGLGYNETGTPTTTTTTVPTSLANGYTVAQVCAQLGQGLPVGQVIVDAMAGDEAWGSADEFVAAAVSSACPQYTSQVQGVQHG